jgi:transposase
MTTTQTASIEQLQAENCSLHHQVILLEEQVAWFKRQIFGKRSEKIVTDVNAQQLTFEELETNENTVPDQTKAVAAHTRHHPNRNGQDKISFPEDLPVEATIFDLSEEQKVCKETGIALVKIGEEVTHKLAHRPGSYYIKKIIRPKYAHPQREENGILTAEMPESILPKCRADDSLLAEILTKKFVDHLPLYRISEILNREGIKISRKLLSQWVLRCGMTLKPLYNEMLKKILASQNVFVDEVPVDVQDIQKVRQGYMWVLVGGQNANPPYRIYDFRENRSHSHALEIFADYQGVLHSDKYGAYETLANTKQITWCPCWSHIRRKFFEAESGDPTLRCWVLRKIRYLFMLEKVAWARTEEERIKIREEKEVPIIDELIREIKHKLVNGKLLPKSKLHQALGYFCSLISHLKNYTKHPFARLDNNVAERAVRPIVLGRKNWLFFGSCEGGMAGGIILSLVQTCRGLGINPRKYLEDVFRRLMNHKAQKLHELLPDQWQLHQQ